MSELYQGFIEVNTSYNYRFTLVSIIHDVLVRDWPSLNYVFFNKVVLKDYGEYFLFHLYGKDLKDEKCGYSDRDPDPDRDKYYYLEGDKRDYLGRDKGGYVPECWDIETMIPLDYSLKEALLAIKLCLENECSNIGTRIRMTEEERKFDKMLNWDLNSRYSYDLINPPDLLNDLRYRKNEFENVCKYLAKKIM